MRVNAHLNESQRTHFGQVFCAAGVIIGVGYIYLSLTLSMVSAQSAMQASQLYNEATVEMLGLIAFVLLVIFLVSAK